MDDLTPVEVPTSHACGFHMATIVRLVEAEKDISTMTALAKKNESRMDKLDGQIRRLLTASVVTLLSALAALAMQILKVKV